MAQNYHRQGNSVSHSPTALYVYSLKYADGQPKPARILQAILIFTITLASCSTKVRARLCKVHIHSTRSYFRRLCQRGASMLRNRTSSPRVNGIVPVCSPRCSSNGRDQKDPLERSPYEARSREHCFTTLCSYAFRSFQTFVCADIYRMVTSSPHVLSSPTSSPNPHRVVHLFNPHINRLPFQSESLRQIRTRTKSCSQRCPS